MKIYLRLSPHGVEKELKAMELGGNLNDKMYPTLTAIDFGDGLINLRIQSEYDKNMEKIEKFFSDNMENIIVQLHNHNILDMCELDNIIELDSTVYEGRKEGDYKIHIGYADEFGIN